MVYLILIISLPLIIFGADLLVSGSVSIARRYKVSDFAIGALIVGIGTSFPELVVSVIGAIQGNSDVAIGNVIGSNIFNILGILGLTSLILPVNVHKDNLKFDLPLCIAISIIATLLTFNFFANDRYSISRIDGILLLALFIAFILLTFYINDKNNKNQDEKSIEKPSIIEQINLPKMIFKILFGLTMLIIGSNYFVNSAEAIALQLGVDQAFISITLIACGTSLPELVASLTAAFKKNTELALGNIIGSNIFNMTLILGISSMITPLQIGNITLIDYVVMITASILPIVLYRKGRLNRVSGGIMFILFIIYNIYLIYTQI